MDNASELRNFHAFDKIFAIGNASADTFFRVLPRIAGVVAFFQPFPIILWSKSILFLLCGGRPIHWLSVAGQGKISLQYLFKYSSFIW
jgi:hypothetical protein